MFSDKVYLMKPLIKVTETSGIIWSLPSYSNHVEQPEVNTWYNQESAGQTSSDSSSICSWDKYKLIHFHNQSVFLSFPNAEVSSLLKMINVLSFLHPPPSLSSLLLSSFIKSKHVWSLSFKGSFPFLSPKPLMPTFLPSTVSSLFPLFLSKLLKMNVYLLALVPYFPFNLQPIAI